MSFNVFVFRILTTVAQYRPNTYNMGALAFIQKGATMGLQAADKLPTALETMLAKAGQLYTTRADDSGYRTVLAIGELMMSAALKQLHYARKDEDNKANGRYRPGFSLTPAATEGAIPADAWAEGSIVDQGEDRMPPDADPESRDMLECDESVLEVRLTPAEIDEYCDQLEAMFIKAALAADQIVNSWRPDYGTRPALPWLSVRTIDGTYRHAATKEQGLQYLQLMEDETAQRRNMQQRQQAAIGASSW